MNCVTFVFEIRISVRTVAGGEEGGNLWRWVLRSGWWLALATRGTKRGITGSASAVRGRQRERKKKKEKQKHVDGETTNRKTKEFRNNHVKDKSKP